MLEAYLNLPETEDAREFSIQDASTIEEKAVLENAMPNPAASNLEDGRAGVASRSPFVVQLQQVSLSAEAITILKDISLNIKTGDTVMVFGPVGCGKSTLLRAVLGEIKPSSGSVTLATRSVAYCSQVAWIQNETIQGNILGGRPLNLALYNKVVRMPPIFARIWLGKEPQNRLYFIGYAPLGVLSPCLYYWSPIVYYKLIVRNCAPGLHQELLDATAHATFEFLAAEDAGTLLNRFSQDVQMATQRLPSSITPVVWGLCALVIDVGVIAAGATYALPVIPFFLIVVGVIAHFYLRTSRQVRLVELDSSKRLIRHLTESATGIEHIRAFRWEQAFAAQAHRMLQETQKPYYYLLAVQQWLTAVMDFTTAGSAVCIVSLALNFKSSTSASAMGLALLTLISFSDFTGFTVQWFVQMENMFGAVARIREFAQSTPKESDQGASAVPERWPVSGQVELDGVNASYKLESEKPHQALDNIQLSVQPGQTVGLVGRTGSGKSSMLLALLRLLEYTGNIYIDGRELRTIPRNVLRARITTVTQSGIALKASVRFNMNPFAGVEDPSADEQMTDILQRVGLREHIEARGGLDATIGAMKFSVGERQLFQLARAILHKDNTGSRLFLMDEGTSSIDEATEQRIYSLIKECFVGCTKIIISHREVVLADTDVVLHLSDGRGEVRAGSRTEKADEEGISASN